MMARLKYSEKDMMRVVLMIMDKYDHNTIEKETGIKKYYYAKWLKMYTSDGDLMRRLHEYKAKIDSLKEKEFQETPIQKTKLSIVQPSVDGILKNRGVQSLIENERHQLEVASLKSLIQTYKEIISKLLEAL